MKRRRKIRNKRENPCIVTLLPILRITCGDLLSKNRITIPLYGTINLFLPFYGTVISLSLSFSQPSRDFFCRRARHHNFTPINADGCKMFVYHVRLRSSILLKQFRTREAEGSKREIIISDIYVVITHKKQALNINKLQNDVNYLSYSVM